MWFKGPVNGRRGWYGSIDIANRIDWYGAIVAKYSRVGEKHLNHNAPLCPLDEDSQRNTNFKGIWKPCNRSRLYGCHRSWRLHLPTWKQIMLKAKWYPTWPMTHHNILTEVIFEDSQPEFVCLKGCAFLSQLFVWQIDFTSTNVKRWVEIPFKRWCFRNSVDRQKECIKSVWKIVVNKRYLW